MAAQNNVQFTGKVGNLIFYKRYGKYYIRMAPDRVRQSKATKKRSTNFGIAARAAAGLRSRLLPVIPFPADRQMQITFVGALAKWLKQSSVQNLQPDDILPHIHHFQFNDKTSIDERFRIPLVVAKTADNLFTLSLPAFVPAIYIFAPAHTVSVNCKITIAGCILKSGTPTGSHSVTLNFPYDHDEIPAQIISLPFQAAEEGNLVVTGMALEYNILKNGRIQKCSNSVFMPSGIIMAAYY